MDSTPRTFSTKTATRERTPLLVGLVGPSGGGKTFSALRLATGIQRVAGGPIFFIDTESRRALHYAERFKFEHLDFRPPFGSLDYLAAIQHCAKEKAGVIVVDSFSHEHFGQGGVLEMHESETKRLAELWKCSEFKTQMPAWSRPKAGRMKLLNGIIQLGVNLIACFRAKEKIKIITGKDPINLGWQPIAGEEFIFEMTANALLMPNAGGIPTWLGAEPGEKQMIKLPDQFRQKFLDYRQPLDEHLGEFMAQWAAGKSPTADSGKPAGLTVKDLESRFLACRTRQDVLAIKTEIKGKKVDGTPAELKMIAGLANRLEEQLPEAQVAEPHREEPSDESEPTSTIEPGGGQLFGAETDLSATKA